MTLPEVVQFCDAVELGAIALQKPLFDKDISKLFFPGQSPSDVEGDIKDVFALAKTRSKAASGGYPFIVSDHSITFQSFQDFNAYSFFLLGRSLEFGGPVRARKLLTQFRHYFEDVVRWTLLKAGLASEVLSEPREPRGLHVTLATALREISERFQESAILQEDKLLPHDNDLAVDVLAIPIKGNASRGGWPTFQIQCATGAIVDLQSKLQDGSENFSTVWENGFFRGSRIRAVATPDDLLKLNDVYWHRLGQAGWVLDRTRLAHLSSTNRAIPLPTDVRTYWESLWAARGDIAWQGGGQ